MEAQHLTLSLPDAQISYHVRGPLPPEDGRPALVMIGQPMTSEGFDELAAQCEDRTVVTYDPRGLGASTRSDGTSENLPAVQAEDLHALVAEIGGPVDVFASSGGAVAGLAWVAAHPDDVAILVAHEPPLIRVLDDADAARRAFGAVTDAYHARGWGAGMAAFIAMTSHSGEFTEEYFQTPLPGPEMFGMPAEDDGRRDDPLLSGSSNPVTEFEADLPALTSASTRLLVAVGEETGQTFTGRTSEALAAQLGQEPTVFPGGHGSFTTYDPSQPSLVEPFAARLREVLGG